MMADSAAAAVGANPDIGMQPTALRAAADTGRSAHRRRDRWAAGR